MTAAKRSTEDDVAAPVREWVTFDDPREPDRRWQIDITFLGSRWQCIYGNGCQGVHEQLSPQLMHGCCSHGAYFADKADRVAVEAAAQLLTADDWQYRDEGLGPKGIAAKVGKKEWRTRKVKGACVFLNRPGFAGGAGCALHQYSMRTGTHYVGLKPEICWQLPLRRIDEEQDDGSVISMLTEFSRSSWGEGGADFAWWCTEAPEAFTAAEPVYRTMSNELREMLGPVLYDELSEYLDARIASVMPPALHPTEVRVELVRKTS
jgi:hypothetical protein